MSLSLETITTSMLTASARRARVPMTSSASKRKLRVDLHGFECAARRNLVEQVGRSFTRLAANSCTRASLLPNRGDVGGRYCFDNLRSMLLKYTASVLNPVLRPAWAGGGRARVVSAKINRNYR
jgi:hypothetical protein